MGIWSQKFSSYKQYISQNFLYLIANIPLNYNYQANIILKKQLLRTLVKLGKKIFISFQKLFLFSRKFNFRIPHFQILWRHKTPKHKIRNTFYWITWEVNTVANFASLCHITREKFSSKSSKNIAAWKLVPGPFLFANN